MEKEKQLQEICRKLADICTQIKLENAVNINSLSLISENIIRDLLNCIFGYNLENANHICHNQKGYDLIDSERKIIVQVSSVQKAAKVQQSLDKLEFNGAAEWQFYFAMLGEKADNLRNKLYRIPPAVIFNPEKDIFDMTRMIREIHNLDSSRIEKVFHVLCGKPDSEILTKKDIWDAVYKDYQLDAGNDFFALGEEVGWQKSRDGSIYFNILERLLPEGYVSLDGIDANGMDTNGKMISLSNIVNGDSYESMTIIGEGGIGKTTFLRNVMVKAYKNGVYKREKSVPIYIELSRTPIEIGFWYSKRRQKSNFLIRCIAGIVYGLEWDDSSENALLCHERIEQELQKIAVSGKEEYVLLLDGLNEVSMRKTIEDGRTVIDYLYMEILAMQKYSNLVIILTSRHMRQAYIENSTHVIKLVGIQDRDVEWYLEKSGFSRIQINQALINKELMDCLRIPLFLCMFGSRKAEGVKTPCSRGEILYNFFHRDSPYYNEHRTVEMIKEEQSLKGTQIAFIVDFLLPYIGWTMEYIEYYNMEKSYMEELVKGFLLDSEPVIWTEDVEPFGFYSKRKIRVGTIREELSRVPYEKILECMTERLGILYINRKEEVCFVHQHLRDYFAAVYEIQTLKVAYALSDSYRKNRDERFLRKCEEILSEFNENIWSSDKCSFVGEIAGELRNRPKFNGKEWEKGSIVLEEQRFLNQVLKTFRDTGIQPIEGIYNVVETMKLTRKDLSGVNFSSLDLRGCSFNGAVCSHKVGKHLLAADFHASIVNNETFQSNGHKGIVLQMQLSFDGENLFTFGEDGSLIMWDCRTGKRQHSVQTGIKLCEIGKEAAKIEIVSEFEAVISKEDCLIKYNILFGNSMEFEKPNICKQVKEFTYNPETKKIAVVYDYEHIVVYDVETGNWESVYMKNTLCAWSMGDGGVLLLIKEKDNNVILKREERENSFWELGTFQNQGRLVTDYGGNTHIFAAKCTEGIYVMDLDSGWWNVYSLDIEGDINSLKCHWTDKARLTIVSSKHCWEFDYEEQESLIMFQDERIAFPDLVRCAGGKVLFMDEFEHVYLANLSSKEVRRMELSDTTIVRKLFVDSLRKHIIAVDTKQNVTVYDALYGQMVMNIQYHKNGEVSDHYCYHEKSNMLAMAAEDNYHVRIFLIDLETQQEREMYSEITGTEIKGIAFSLNGERIFVAMKKKLLDIVINDGRVQTVESSREYNIHSIRILKDGSIEACLYYPIEFAKCKKKEVYAYRTIYQYDAKEDAYMAVLSGTLPELRNGAKEGWAFSHCEEAFFKNGSGKRAYLNMAVAWNFRIDDIKEGKPIGFPNFSKFQINSDYTIPMVVTYDTMLLLQSYDMVNFQLIEYGERGFFVKHNDLIMEFSYINGMICKEPHIIKPVVMNGQIKEITLITWGFHGNYYSILADGDVVEIDEMGKVYKHFPIQTGISVVGCDFKGADMPDSLREVLSFHGGILSRKSMENKC